MSYPRERADLVVVGAGPAGLSAACEAAELGLEPVVLDENERGGGQLNKQIHKFFGSGAHGAGRRGFEIAEGLLERCAGLGVDLRLGHLAAGAFEERELMVRGPGGISLLECGALIVAAGAVEKPLAFPGWTLPGVMGAGGAQTLMNLQGVLPGRKVAVVGTGNVGLIVGYQLVQAGAEIAAMLEIDPGVKGYGVHEQRLRLLGVPFLLRHELLKAEGRGRVEGMVVRDLERGDCFRYEVDCVCLAVGMSPLDRAAADARLPRLLRRTPGRMGGLARRVHADVAGRSIRRRRQRGRRGGLRGHGGGEDGRRRRLPGGRRRRRGAGGGTHAENGREVVRAEKRSV